MMFAIVRSWNWELGIGNWELGIVTCDLWLLGFGCWLLVFGWIDALVMIWKGKRRWRRKENMRT